MIYRQNSNKSDSDGWSVLVVPWYESNDFQILTCLWQMCEKPEHVDFTLFQMIYHQKCITSNLSECSALLLSQHESNDFQCLTWLWQMYEKHWNVDFTYCF